MAGRINCAESDCVTTGTGARTQGNRSCIEHKCKPCCIKAARAAIAQHLARSRCKTHNIAEVFGAPPATALHLPCPPANPTSEQDVIAPPLPLPSPALSANTIQTRAISPILVPTTVQSMGSTLFNPSSLLAAQPGASMSQVSPQTSSCPFQIIVPSRSQRAPSRRRGDVPLSQPCPPGWVRKHTEAEDIRTTERSLKQQQLGAQERQKRMCRLVIYFKVWNIAYCYHTCR